MTQVPVAPVPQAVTAIALVGAVTATARADGLTRTGHLIRADLYAGQPCGRQPYVFRARIGYYECVHT